MIDKLMVDDIANNSESDKFDEWLAYKEVEDEFDSDNIF